jgi:hypothetical protein
MQEISCLSFIFLLPKSPGEFNPFCPPKHQAFFYGNTIPRKLSRRKPTSQAPSPIRSNEIAIIFPQSPPAPVPEIIYPLSSPAGMEFLSLVHHLLKLVHGEKGFDRDAPSPTARLWGLAKWRQ